MIGFTVMFIVNGFAGATTAHTRMSDMVYDNYETCAVVADKMHDEYKKRYRIIQGYYACMPYEQNAPLEGK